MEFPSCRSMMKGLFVSPRGGKAARRSSLHATAGPEHPLLLTWFQVVKTFCHYSFHTCSTGTAARCWSRILSKSISYLFIYGSIAKFIMAVQLWPEEPSGKLQKIKFLNFRKTNLQLLLLEPLKLVSDQREDVGSSGTRRCSTSSWRLSASSYIYIFLSDCVKVPQPTRWCPHILFHSDWDIK